MNGFYVKCSTEMKWINPFHANVSFLYSLKTSENQRFSDIFRGCRNGTLACKGLRAPAVFLDHRLGERPEGISLNVIFQLKTLAAFFPENNPGWWKI